MILMGRRIGAVVKAQFAVIAFLLDFGKILCREFRHLTFVVVQAIDQRGKRRTQVETAPTPVANIKHPYRFFF